MDERRMIDVNGIQLCIETFGNSGDPAILLIGGATWPMDWWDSEFCERLAAGQRFVIRYDARDTGQSTSYEPGKPSYTGADLIADAVGVLDALEIPQGHLAGLSMGGGIAQHLAIEHADRVASLTLISSSPDGPDESDAPPLPPPTEKVAATFEEPPPDPDWSDRQAVIDYIVEGERSFAGPGMFDEEHVRETAGRVFDRTGDIESCMKNHFLLEGGDPVRHRFGEITAPTLVLHGTHDPLFPLPHGDALAREIPGARLLQLPGVGHQVPPKAVWDIVVPALIQHSGSHP